MLAGRDLERLQRDVADISLRGSPKVTAHLFDALDILAHKGFVASLPALPDVVISTIGLLGDQQAAQSDPTASDLIIRTNLNGVASILGVFAESFEARGAGIIVGFSSVAGERGRASNYLYGAAKAGLTAFLSGLRNRLHSKGVTVITVKPGFIRTRMTEGMDLPQALTSDPIEVAAAVLKAVERRRDVIYVRPIWRTIMAVIRALPEAIFKRTRL